MYGKWKSISIIILLATVVVVSGCIGQNEKNTSNIDTKTKDTSVSSETNKVEKSNIETGQKSDSLTEQAANNDLTIYSQSILQDGLNVTLVQNSFSLIDKDNPWKGWKTSYFEFYITNERNSTLYYIGGSYGSCSYCMSGLHYSFGNCTLNPDYLLRDYADKDIPSGRTVTFTGGGTSYTSDMKIRCSDSNKLVLRIALVYNYNKSSPNYINITFKPIIFPEIQEKPILIKKEPFAPSGDTLTTKKESTSDGYNLYSLNCYDDMVKEYYTYYDPYIYESEVTDWCESKGLSRSKCELETICESMCKERHLENKSFVKSDEAIKSNTSYEITTWGFRLEHHSTVDGADTCYCYRC
ncbi:MAG: hypothetical protein HY831_00250 [Candidatus Aenigmarchaeota archaeon]|nr:hypothetical protein [Candidatus Aenigmarchaeota archaeon]